MLEGDQLHQRGELIRAASKYEAAFQKAPSAELSLKLGEVYYQTGKAREAKAWWQRHLRDDAQSKARRYILEASGNLVQ
jgi:eukaryotic-like serine/threonine-protein kinase